MASPPRRAGAARQRLRWWAASGLIVAVALALRLWRLDGVPAGLSHDEAYDALNAVEILNGAHPVFFESNNGREALFMYVVALSFRLFGVGQIPLRLVAALAGTAAVALTILLGRRLFGWAVGAAGGALMAIAFWPLFDSRVGLRATLLPALVLLLAYCLHRWVGEPTSHRGLVWAALGGLALGVALETYTVARFLVLVPPLFAAYLARSRVLPVRRAVAGLGVTAATALVVAAPLLVYFLAHPASFAERAGQVNDLRFIVREANVGPLVEDTLNTLQMFGVEGDPSMRYNLAGRPVFDPFSAFLFYLGVVVCARILRTRSSQPHPRGPAAALLLIWLVVALLPSATTGESPHFLRAIGAQPAIFLLAAVGLVYVLDWLAIRAERALDSSGARAIVVGAVGLLLFGTALLTVRDYFLVWSAEPEARHIYDAAFAPIARRMLGADGERTFVSAEYPADLDRFVVDVVNGLRPTHGSWFDGRVSLAFTPDGPSTYLIPRTARPDDDVLRRYFGEPPYGGGAEVWMPRLVAPPELAPSHRLSARIGDYLELLGYDVPETAAPGDVARITLYWQILQPPPFDLSIFVHVIGGLGSLWGQNDGLGYPRDQWQPGDRLIQWHDVPVPIGAPPVSYQIEAGAYRRDSGDRLSVQVGARASDRLQLGHLAVERADHQLLPPLATRVGVSFAQPLELAAYELDSTPPMPGGNLRLTLYWRSLDPVGADYTVFTHLVGDDPRPVAQADGPPAYGMFPTSAWRRDDLVRDVHEVALPPGLLPGRYHLLVGLYQASNGARLAPADPPTSALARLRAWLDRHTPYRAPPRVDGDRVVLTAVDVRGR